MRASGVPSTVEELNGRLVTLLEAGDWKQVWRLWMECKGLLGDQSEDTKEDVEGDEDMRREDQIQNILTKYCKVASQTKSSIFVMTVNPVVLMDACSRLMNLCLQLQSNLKQLERTVSQGTRALEAATESTL